jgi:hypothetical protein
MTGWLLVSGIIWMCLVTVVIVLALSRIAAVHRDHNLMRAGAGAATSLHIHLRQVIRSEDRIGVILTICTVICTLIFGLLFADDVVRTIIHKIVYAFAFE